MTLFISGLAVGAFLGGAILYGLYWLGAREYRRERGQLSQAVSNRLTELEVSHAEEIAGLQASLGRAREQRDACRTARDYELERLKRMRQHIMQWISRANIAEAIAAQRLDAVRQIRAYSEGKQEAYELERQTRNEETGFNIPREEAKPGRPK